MPKLWPISWARFSQAVTDPMLVTENAALSVVEVGPGSGRLAAPELSSKGTAARSATRSPPYWLRRAAAVAPRTVFVGLLIMLSRVLTFSRKTPVAAVW